MFKPAAVKSAIVILLLTTACFRIELGDGAGFGGDD